MSKVKEAHFKTILYFDVQGRLEDIECTKIIGANNRQETSVAISKNGAMLSNQVSVWKILSHSSLNAVSNLIEAEVGVKSLVLDCRTPKGKYQLKLDFQASDGSLKRSDAKLLKPKGKPK